MRRTAKNVVVLSVKDGTQRTIAANLPLGPPASATPRELPGVSGLIPGPLLPFTGLAIARDGTVYLAGDGDGSVITLRRHDEAA